MDAACRPEPRSQDRAMRRMDALDQVISRVCESLDGFQEEFSREVKAIKTSAKEARDQTFNACQDVQNEMQMFYDNAVSDFNAVTLEVERATAATTALGSTVKDIGSGLDRAAEGLHVFESGDVREMGRFMAGGGLRSAGSGRRSFQVQVRYVA